MAIGLYIHVPFCIKKCSYCDFISYPYDAELAASYVYALPKEMAMHTVCMCSEHREVKSIYIGGGTPTALQGTQLAGIMDNCRKYFKIQEDAEITVECNPGTVDFAKFKKLREAGVNRISIGVQASQEKILNRLGRIHRWQEVLGAAKDCRQAGFDNLSLDLIFGIPGQTLRDWQETLERILEISPQHISAYNLKIEPDTPLYRDITAGYIMPLDEELELEMFWYTIDFLNENGFNHYEISNFAKPGREARHNLIYWLNEEYLGLGPAAHSMLNGHRFSNLESVEKYIRRLTNNESVIYQLDHLTREEQISESVFLGLRIMKGLDLLAFEQRFGQPLAQLFEKNINKLFQLGLVEEHDNRLKLTKKGLPVANEVFAEFI